MRISIKAASTACFLIVIGLLIHNLNALYLEPYTLGFENKTQDYGDMAKIENALWSFSFTSSGLSHIVVGFSMMFLGLGLADVFREAHPAAARLIVLSACLSGLGFLLTGISDIPGTVVAGLLRDLNPDYNTTILLMTTLFRSFVNILAVIGLGWFAGQVAWCTLKTGIFPKWFGYYGWVNVLPGIASLIFPPAGFAYIQLYPIWMAALGIFLRRKAQE